ncbi:hypothetical protein Ancab_007732 [Ancistrocladus abbreviatus]
MIKINDTTSLISREIFARLWLHMVCFDYGCYGHHDDDSPFKDVVAKGTSEDNVIFLSAIRPALTAKPEALEGFGPWMLVS